MASCPAFDPSGPYISNVLIWADCRILSFGTNGYAALGPSSTYGAAWTGLLTILVALFGYRLLFSGTFSLREVMVNMVKIGAVLALAGQWPAYRVLVFNVFTAAPVGLTSGLLAQPKSSPAAAYGLATRADRATARIANLVVAQRQLLPAASVSEEKSTAEPQNPVLSGQDQSNLMWASTFLSISTLGGLLSVRLVTGILLGLGPLFVAFLLFPATQGLFVGWVRRLISAGVGSIAATLIVRMELSVIEPQLIALGARINGADAVGALPAAIFATGALFALLMVIVLAVLAKITNGWRLPSAAAVSGVFRNWRSIGQMVLRGQETSLSREPSFSGGVPQMQSRARSVGEALQALDRREQQVGIDRVRLMKAGDAGPVTAGSGELPARLALGQSDRRSAPRKSIAADRRNDLK